MNSFKIIIAAAVIMLVSNGLSGCSTDTPSSPGTSIKTSSPGFSSLGMARIEAATALKKTAEISLKEISKQGNISRLQLVLTNPEAQPITSVESWISFNPKLVKGNGFKVNEKAFNLSAPYTNGFDQEHGLLRFGRSTTTPITSHSIILADLTFESTSDIPVLLEAYDYQYDISGHSSVNRMDGETPINILLKPDSPMGVVNTN